MLPLLTEDYGNPSSPHGPGRACARGARRGARAGRRRALNAEPREIVFTAGGTEVDQPRPQGRRLGGQGAGQSHRDHGRRAPRRAARAAPPREVRLRDRACCPVDRYGRVDPEHLEAAINDRTVLVSLHARQQRGRHDPADGATWSSASALTGEWRSTSTPSRPRPTWRSTFATSTSTCCRSRRTSSRARRARVRFS